ncbi:TPA: accessory Sec system protein Asp2 [Streptococcus suis]
MAKIKILQVGDKNWRYDLILPPDMAWDYSSPEELSSWIYQQEERLNTNQSLVGSEKGVWEQVRFTALLLTSAFDLDVLDTLADRIEAHTAFYLTELTSDMEGQTAWTRRKVLKPLPVMGQPQQIVDFLGLTLFTGQYGAKLKLPEIVVSPQFKGTMSNEGNLATHFEGDFGEEFEPLYTYRYNLSSFPMALELWLEYEKHGNCQLLIEIISMEKGSLGTIKESRYVTENDFQRPYILQQDDSVGFYAISVYAKGQGRISVGALHWRYSRQGLGQFVLGGKRYQDARRQELFTYFNPGDLKPPLTVYFSGFRGAEGFEGFYMMKSLGTPFFLVADPRLEGGCFYSGSSELENHLVGAIQEALDYLGFSRHELILSGLSMGAFGSLYYAADLEPYAVIVGKPFTNLGDTTAALKLKRPGEFETSADMIRNVTGGSDQRAIEQWNQRFWNKFGATNFSKTVFAIAYMEQDDYDGLAIKRLIPHLAETQATLFAKGYEGRHNDNSRSINKWFMTQYHKLLHIGFGRES